MFPDLRIMSFISILFIHVNGYCLFGHHESLWRFVYVVSIIVIDPLIMYCMSHAPSVLQPMQVRHSGVVARW